jgi:hypothetical protein
MRKLVAFASVVSIFAASPAYAVDTTVSTDANALATSLQGPGVTFTGATLTSNGPEVGLFSNGAAALGIDSGIVLTTGGLGCVGSSNTSTQCTGASGSASSLALAFTATSTDLFFNYVFASEEYNEFVNQGFNDTFSLLLNGPGFSNVNLAVLPGGGGVVSIDNVNNGSNSAFYRDNTVLGLPIQYDGLTTVLTAQALGLTIGSSYTLTFGITDNGDTVLDSAVFIQGGSVGVVTPPTGGVPEPGTWAMMLLGFGAIGLAMRRKHASVNALA